MPRGVRVEINMDDPERAVKFYTDAFGWEIKSQESF
jgi:predicted enzyme related to lactoylglutathione lyase